MADLIDIKIENGRFVLDSTGDFVFVRGAERVRQQIEFHLSLWRGEWFLDTEFGTPYTTDILGKIGANRLTLDAAVASIRAQILSVEGVDGILSLDYKFDQPSRTLSVSVEVSTLYGIVKYNIGENI